MKKRKTLFQQAIPKSEVLSTKFHEFIESMVEAGNAAKWEEHSSEFDPEEKHSVEEAAKYYGDLLKKVNEKFDLFQQKIKKVFPD